MKIELTKTGRYSFPTGVMDFVIRHDERMAIAACLDGIYGLALPSREVRDAKPNPGLLGRHSSYVSGIAMLEGESAIASTGYDGEFQIRQLKPDSIAESEPTYRQRLHPFWSWRMAISPDRNKIASVSGQYLAGSADYSPMPSDYPTVQVVEAASGKLLQSFDFLPPVQCVTFDTTGQFLAAGNLMGDLAVWDLATGVKLAAWRTDAFTSWGIIKSHCYISGIFAVSFAPDSQSLYAAGMGQMRDPMAGNGKQLWQRFDWRRSPVEKIQESVAEQTGEGLMETLAWHPSGEFFVMAGRLRGGNWNAGLFERESGNLIGQVKTGMRISAARFSPDGKSIFFGGMQGQPGPKEGKFPDFGYIERFDIEIS